MKKFLTTSLAFLICNGIFYVAAVFVWGNLTCGAIKPNINYPLGAYGHMHSRVIEAKRLKDIDVLFMGSSHAYRGFDTRIFSHHGLRTFNFGSSAQTPIQTNLLLERYLTGLNPKTVIYEVYPETFMNDGTESSLDIVANDRNDFLSLKMIFEVNNIIAYNTYIYAVVHDILNLNKSFVEPVIKGSDTYISGGFVEKEMRYFKPYPLKKKKIRINQKQLNYFKETVDKLKNKGINVILVYAPITKSSYCRYSNNEYFDAVMKSHAPYYNFNELLPLDDTFHFYDSNHLNQNGVTNFNKKLIEILAGEKEKFSLSALTEEASE